MQSAVVAEQTGKLALPTAEALKEMTVTKEALFNRQKENVLEDLMSGMVQNATGKGETLFVANLNPQFPAALIPEITKELESLGYKITSEAKTDPQAGTFTVMTISWA